MRLLTVTTAAACAIGAGGLQAQPEDASAERQAHDVYVLGGCLEVDPEVAEGFMLTDATARGPAPPEAGLDETGAPQTTYRLRPVSGITESGADADELSMHVGFLVEVTVRPPDTVPEADTPPGVAQPGASASIAEPEPPPFSVTAVDRQGGECG